jgi:hypothetical protein
MGKRLQKEEIANFENVEAEQKEIRSHKHLMKGDIEIMNHHSVLISKSNGVKPLLSFREKLGMEDFFGYCPCVPDSLHSLLLGLGRTYLDYYLSLKNLINKQVNL